MNNLSADGWRKTIAAGENCAIETRNLQLRDAAEQLAFLR